MMVTIKRNTAHHSPFYDEPAKTETKKWVQQPQKNDWHIYINVLFSTYTRSIVMQKKNNSNTNKNEEKFVIKAERM